MKNNNENMIKTEEVKCKEKIVEMVGQIENEDYLFEIYHYILAKYRRDKK